MDASRRAARVVAVIAGLVAATGLTGCAGVGVNHTLSGIAYKTFTASLPDLRRASKGALADMAIAVEREADLEDGRLIIGKAGDHTVDIELVKLTASASRMRVTVIEANGIFRDSATATEIIIQTSTKLESQLAGRPSRR